MTWMDIDYELMLLFSKMNASKRFVILYTNEKYFSDQHFSYIVHVLTWRA